MMKKLLFSLIVALALPSVVSAEAWPEKYEGVMLQGFYWDSFTQSKWKTLEAQAGDFENFFSLVWVPQSGNCGGTSMGYDDLYWFPNGASSYSSSFGNEAALRSMINTFKEHGIGTIADVVINHRKSNSGWFGFPAETYKGVTYKMTAADVCSTDDGGKAKTEANRLGVTLGQADTGEDWDGMRDLDHKIDPNTGKSNVQEICKAYTKMLIEDLGYAGFRYDMVKGYAAEYTGLYNSYSKPQFSVGEYWDGNRNAVVNWINGTKVDGIVQSAAFDFPFRYSVRDACNGTNQWNKLANGGVATASNYKRYAVTFIENHDTEYRSAKAPQDPIKANVLAGYAFMLSMPGTPCVFLKHWVDNNYNKAIRQLIHARQMAALYNTSTHGTMKSEASVYAVRTLGRIGQIVCVVGNTGNFTPDASLYQKFLTGSNFAIYASKATNSVWIDEPSGTYYNSFEATLTAITDQSGAQIVYTLDGSDPTASSAKIASGGKVTIPMQTTTLKAGLLVGGEVKNIVKRVYTFTSDEPFTPYTATVYLKDPTVAPNNWTKVNYYSWDGNGTVNDSWPGRTITDTKVINGTKFYYRTYNINTPGYTFNCVLNQGDNNHQTEDITDLDHDIYLEVITQTNKYQVKDITSEFVAITDVIADPVDNGPYNVYTIDGRMVRQNVLDKAEATAGLPRGIYIVNHKKVLVR